MPTEQPAAPPRVFISYSHDSEEHQDRVRGLAHQLRQDGVDAWMDVFVDSPPEGWPQWMINQIEEARFVLVVCTETYERRASGKEVQGRGLGGRWEGAVITLQLYQRTEGKFIPVVFEPSDTAHIPVPLRAVTYYDLSADGSYDALYDRLVGRFAHAAPPLGARRPTLPAPEPRWRPKDLDQPFTDAGDAAPDLPAEPGTQLGTSTGDDPWAGWVPDWPQSEPGPPPAVEPPLSPPPALPLAQVLPGAWTVQIGNQLGVMGQGNLTLAPTGFFQGQLMSAQGTLGVEGMWQVAPPAQLLLQGRQGTPFWVNPYRVVLTFQQVTPSQLTGTTDYGEQTIWNRVA
jgi:hypothetical protein